MSVTEQTSGDHNSPCTAFGRTPGFDLKRRALSFGARLSSQQLLLVVATLALFLIAFVPTLTVDYVPMDQWRAFRYSPTDDGSSKRFRNCVDLTVPHYVATGRPLVWQGECIEHALVGRIGDFQRLRPLCLFIVLTTIFGLAYAFRDLVEDPALRVIIGAAVLYSPGYCFMYYQGLTAAPVLVAALLAACSFGILLPVYFSTMNDVRRFSARLVSSFALFALTCFIYPAYAFVALALALLQAIFDPALPLYQRARRFAGVVALYGSAAVAYFAASKLLIAVYFWWINKSLSDVLPISSEYNLTMSFGQGQLLNKLQTLWFYFFHRLSLMSFSDVPSFAKYALVAGLIAVATAPRGSEKWITPARLFVALIGLCVAMVILIVPWLASGFLALYDRHMLAWEVVSAAGVILLGVRVLSARRLRLGKFAQSCLIFTLLFIPATVRQVKASVDQVLQSNVEIRYLRTSLKRLVASRDIYRIRRLHVIRPSPAFKYDGNPRTESETDLPATAANPEHIYQMVTAVLREFVPPVALRRLEIADCRFDKACVRDATYRGRLALTQGFGSDPAPRDEASAVIDFRLTEVGPAEPLSGEHSPDRPATVSVYPDPGCCLPHDAFDGNKSTFFESETGFPVRFVIQKRGSCQLVASYAFMPHLFPQRMPSAWRMFGRSSSADDWQLLDQRKNVGSWNEFARRVFKLRAEVCLNEFKFDLLKSEDSKRLRIADIALQSHVPDKIEITTSSVSPPYFADGLLEAVEPGWHAAPSAGYPQWIMFDFPNLQQVGSVGLLPQSGYMNRAPRDVVVETSDEGVAWDRVMQVVNACDGSDSTWTYHSLPKQISTYHLRLTILSNCGSAEILTLRGVKLRP